MAFASNEDEDVGEDAESGGGVDELGGDGRWKPSCLIWGLYDEDGKKDIAL